MADDRIEAHREPGLRRVRDGVTGTGTVDCTDCGDEIEALRRAAMPSATRCICCQQAADNYSRLERLP